MALLEVRGAGWISSIDEEIFYADVNLSGARRNRNWNEYNQLLRDRRTDVYAEMLGSDVDTGWYSVDTSAIIDVTTRSWASWNKTDET